MMYRVQLRMYGGRWYTCMTFQTIESVRTVVPQFASLMGGTYVRVQIQRGVEHTHWVEMPWAECLPKR